MAQAAAIPSARRRNGTWFLAVLLSLLLHVLAVTGLRWWDPFAAQPLPEREDPVMEFVFEPPAEVAEPTQFTELPEDRADTPPERPELLSNVDSRARDAAPGGEAFAGPRSEGLSDFPAVAMNPAAGGGPATEEHAPQAEPESKPSAAPEDAQGAETLPRLHPLAAYRGIGREAAMLAPEAPASDAEDIYQEAADSPAANAALSGDISLSTTAWVYGHWMQRFRRAVQQNWYPPYAFQIGMIFGWTQLELEVAPSGKLLRVEVLDEEGHGSLRESSLAAMRSAAPFEALPADFPDPTLVIQVKMNYLNAMAERSRRGR